jgi:phosphatidylserine synthase 2
MFARLYLLTLRCPPERYVEWMVHPYGISSLIALSAVALFVAMGEGRDSRSNALLGFYFALFVYLIVAANQFRDSLLLRPHPVFWRLVKAFSFLYLFGLVWLLFQNVDDARRWMSFWDPNLGVALAERSYAAECDIWTPNDPVSSFRHIRFA